VKALLTSVGVANDTIRSALVELLGKPIAECAAVHVPTAVYGLPEGLGYSTEMTRYWDALGWAELGTLELTTLPSLPEELWRPSLEAADAILVAGGNSGYLSYWAHQTRFAELLPELLDKAVYVGFSAGSCLLTPGYNYDPDRLAATGTYYDDEYDEAAPPGAGDFRALGLVDFHLRPHLNSTDFGVDLSAAAMERAAAKVDGPLYAIDDQTALVVAGRDIRVVSEGDWLLFNADTDQEDT
jgi:dipeptidase E